MAQTTETSTIQRLNNISSARRPLHKIVLSSIEGSIGQAFYRRMPPNIGNSAKLLHLGCGDYHFDGWVNADYYRFSDLIRKKRGLPDWMLDLSKPWNCPNDYWDGIYTEHTLEHVDYPGAILALQEVRRSLKPDKWIRIVLPGLEKVLQSTNCRFKAEAAAWLTQTHGHVSVWDQPMLCELLSELKFRNIRPVDFGQGTDSALVKDLEDRRHESIYIEAQK